MIRLNEAERKALSAAAWAQRRQARELAEVLLRRWLIRRGYLFDPSGAGQCVAREKSEASSVLSVGSGGAAS